jgi:hypothetical protein
VSPIIHESSELLSGNIEKAKSISDDLFEIYGLQTLRSLYPCTIVLDFDMERLFFLKYRQHLYDFCFRLAKRPKSA